MHKSTSFDALNVEKILFLSFPGPAFAALLLLELLS
jgi:hypothetical protein